MLNERFSLVNKTIMFLRICYARTEIDRQEEQDRILKWSNRTSNV